MTAAYDMPHSTGETLKVMRNKGSANHRELETDFYMSFNRVMYYLFQGGKYYRLRDIVHNQPSMDACPVEGAI